MGVTSGSSSIRYTPRGGKVVLQRSQWASSGALLVSTMAPYIHMADDVMLSLENGPKWYVH